MTQTGPMSFAFAERPANSTTGVVNEICLNKQKYHSPTVRPRPSLYLQC